MAMALSHQPSTIRFNRVPLSSHTAVVSRCLGTRFLALDRGRRPNLSLSHSFVAFAASPHEESHGETEVEKERTKLESVKERAIKLQGQSQEAHKVYSLKAMVIVILMEASKKLKIDAEKVSHDLAEVAKELCELELNQVSEVGIPYGLLLSVGGFLSFILTGITFVIRFGIVLGGALFTLGILLSLRSWICGKEKGQAGLLLSVGGFLSFMLIGIISVIRYGIVLGGAFFTLSILSLRSWIHGEASAPLLKEQAAIATIIFLRELHLLSQRSSVSTSFMTLISIMLLFCIFRIMKDGQRKGASAQQSQEI